MTPLALIQGYTSALLLGTYGKIDSVAKDYLSEVREACFRMNRLIKDFLNVSKFESGQISLEKHYFDISSILAKTCSDFESLLKITREKKNLSIYFTGEKAVVVFADENYTREVVINLLDNATKFTSKGKITVCVKKKDHLAEISVSDTGIGIKPEELPHIFEKFYWTEGWVSTQRVSNKLGLYVAKLLVEKMGGTIQVESTKGRGSTFTFTLPLGPKP